MKKLNFLQADELHKRACCTTGQASGLHIRQAGGGHSELVCGKGRTGRLLFFAARPFPQPAGPPFSAARRPALLSSVQPAKSSRFSFGNPALHSARPASPPITVIRKKVTRLQPFVFNHQCV